MQGSKDERNPVEVLADEFVARLRKGERPPLSEYTERYPHLAQEIEKIFPERLRRENLSPVAAAETPAQPQSSTAGLGQLGDYRIIREVGRGGMGVVYEAEQVSLGRHVALKVLPKLMLANSKHRLRFEREARAAAKLHHTNIVPVFGVGEDDGQLYYVMQFIDGLPLNEVLAELRELRAKADSVKGFAPLDPAQPKAPVASAAAAVVAQSLMVGALPQGVDDQGLTPSRHWQSEVTVTFQKPLEPDGPHVVEKSDSSPRRSNLLSSSDSSLALPGSGSKGDSSAAKQPSYFESIARIGYQVADALHYAHGQGVLHRDIKPANLVLDMLGTVWITDFGLAKLDDDHGLTQTGDVLGTLRYMAPETFSGVADARSEVYSLGLTLYEMLAFRPAFDQNNRIAVYDHVMHARWEPLGKLNPEVPNDLQTIIHKAIDREPAHRYQTARDLADELQRFIKDEPIQARRISYLERLARWSRHNKGLAASLSALALLVTVIAVSSTVAAGYFQSLSGRLNSTVSELTAATSKLTGARDDAEEARKQAVKVALEADAARKASQTTLADMQTERGLLAAAQGDSATAMLWFTEAATQTPHDTGRQKANLLRARNWMRNTLLPVALLPNASFSDPVRVMFQPRGELLLSWKPGSLKIWNLHLEQSLSWTDALEQVSAVCWSSDGRQLALGFPSGELQIRNIPTGEIARTLKHPERIEALAFSRNGKWLAIGGNSVEVWNLSTVGDLTTATHQWPHPAAVHSLGFNSDGSRLVTACQDQQARVFAVGEQNQSPAPLFAPLPHTTRLNDVPVFIQEDRQLITVNQNSNKLGWWDAGSGQDVTPPGANVQVGMVNRLAVSADGRSFAAAAGFAATVWNFDGQRTVLAHPNDVTSVQFSPDGRSLLTGCEDWMMRMWSVAALDRPASSVPQLEGVRICAFSDDGTLAAAAGWAGIRVWKVPEDYLIVGHAENWNQRFMRPRPSFDGRLVTFGIWHESPFPIFQHSTVTVVNSRDGRAAGPVISLAGIVDTCLCGDNRTLAIASSDGQTDQLSFFDVATGRASIPPLTLPSGAGIRSVAARPNSPHVAAMCSNGETVIVDHRDGKTLQLFRDQPWSSSLSMPRVTYSPDGSKLLVLSGWQEITVRDAETGEILYAPIRPVLTSDTLTSGVCRTFTFSSDSRWLATGANGRNSVQIWDLSTGLAASEPLLHPGDFYGIFAVAFSPDGKWVLSGNKDGRARLWDWRTGKLVCPPMQNSDEVLDVAFTRDGLHAVTGVRSQTARFWELTTGKQIAPPARYLLPQHTSTDTITMLGDRVLLGSVGYPIIDVSPLFQESTQSIKSLQTLAELATGGHLELGELSGLAPDEWRDRWEHFRDREFTSQAIAGLLARELDQAKDSYSLELIADRASRSEALLVELDRLRPEIPQLKIALAKKSEKHGDTQAAAEFRSRAVDLYEREYEKRPADSALASQLARLLEQSSKVTWHKLDLRGLHSRDATTLTYREDGSILASGNHVVGDVYTVTGLPAGNRATAIRLEVLPDPSLPLNGPGRHESGNFQLAAFRLYRIGTEDNATAHPVRISDAWASYTYPAPPINILGTIREERHQVWHVFGRPGRAHQAIFTLEQPLILKPWEMLIVELKHHDHDPAINLGCFRLTTTGEDFAAQREQNQLEGEWQRFSTGLLLAVAYLNGGQPEKTLKVLERLPETTVPNEPGVRLLVQTQAQQRFKPDEARKTYDRLIDWLHENSLPEFLDSQVTELMLTFGGLTAAESISLRQRWAAEAEIHQITQLIELQQATADHYFRRADLFAKLGQWRQAADDHLRLCKLVPADRRVWLQASAPLLLAGDLNGYRNLCQDAIVQFRETQDVWELDVVCKIGLLQPDSVPYSSLPVEALRGKALSDSAVKTHPWFGPTCALAALRAGNYQQARDLSEQSTASPDGRSGILAALVRAMAEHHLGKHEVAKALLAEATAKIPEELKALGRSDYNGKLPVDSDVVHFDMLIAELLRREAHGLIDGTK